MPAVPEAPVTLVVDLGAAAEARMPHRATIAHLDVEVELISGRGVPSLDVAVTIYVHNGRAFPE